MKSPILVVREFLKASRNRFLGDAGLYLYGGVGVGKTLLSACALYEYLYSYPAGWTQVDGTMGAYPAADCAGGFKSSLMPARRVVFVGLPDLLSRLRSTFDSASETRGSALIENWAECDLLVLDDLGAERVTDWTVEVLYGITNARYEAQLPTVFTSNHSLDDLDERLSARIADRILEMCKGRIVHIDAESYRA